MKTSGIYKIVNTANGKYYVGSSNDIAKRWRAHKKHLVRNYHENDHLQKSWNKYGEKVFDFVIIKTFPNGISRKELLKEEQVLLDVAYKNRNNTYNLTFLAGGGTLGGKDSPNFGHRHTIESKRKMSVSKLGFRHSETTKQKISTSRIGKYSGQNHSMFGRHHSEETKRKLSKEWKFISPVGSVLEINNLTEFCKINGLDTSCMCKVFHGKLLQYKKWKAVSKIEQSAM